ncbi:hypothetical protein C8R46DRAFT_1199526 [Mycena filopes]|nr:hypothetical protein C8R46DRAFT_1199526 [Mycena filopes]
MFLCFSISRRARRRVSPKTMTTSPSGIIHPPSAAALDSESRRRTTFNSDSAKTFRNVLISALTKLSAVFTNFALGGRSNIVDPLLAIVRAKPIEPTPESTKGFSQLAAQIELIRSNISQMAEDQPKYDQNAIEALQRALKSIAKDIEAARAKGRLVDFLEDSSCLAKHNMTLTQIIAGFNFVSGPEVFGSVCNLERIKLEQFACQEATELGSITGGFGGTGGKGRLGGAGGEGGGPELHIDPQVKVGNVSGGNGGAGGDGKEVGEHEYEPTFRIRALGRAAHHIGRF